MQKYKPETSRTVRGNTISLVEKLLDTRIDDYRKNALVDHQITKSATNRSMLARFHPARSDFTVYSTLSSFPFLCRFLLFVKCYLKDSFKQLHFEPRADSSISTLALMADESNLQSTPL